MLFVETMGPPERRAFVEVLCYLASADGELSPPEASFIEQRAAELGLDAADLLANAGRSGLAELAAPLREQRHRRALLLELVRLAHADQRFSTEELAVISELAELFGLDERSLLAIKDWVALELEWRRAEPAVDQPGA